ncbi:hypothetical protein ABB37_05100 [Leptomonas pyrrhocoris]|uniref:Neurobeachin/beige protein n=1 Tax=Leptomonas pyrrhocoris TaxID=157538 RepID=A0A0M9G175_LEPPY|nr:hypothetical protein ABB37_05100 [Leptomonas pyrrhocoris]KPA80099.1 hypothetical protein ABB37_05100 [Leptomonas pyrrhocoris]|eukprot:XP_015658538.1 hypothetical protein ABB37_05100 [Leptomonas pyrrhocoris]
MFDFWVNVFTGHRASDDRTTSSSSVAAAAAEVSPAAQRKEEEQRQRLLAERRRAYSEFVKSAALGKVLAARLPRAHDILAYTGDAPSAFENKYADQAADAVQDEGSSPGGNQLTSSNRDATEAAANSTLERGLYAALTPLLSRGTTVVTARVLELVGHPEASSAKVGIHDDKAAFDAQKESIADSVAQGRLPFLFVSLLLRRWQVCLLALTADTSSNMLSAPTLNTLRTFSCVLASFVALTEVHTEDVRAHLEDLQVPATQCIEESLRCLHFLSHPCTSSASYAPKDATAAAAAAATSEQPDADASTVVQNGTTSPFFTQDSSAATEAVQVQVWRLLSLLLYWLHMVHGAPVAHLNVVTVFLSTSATALGSESSLASRIEKSDDDGGPTTGANDTETRSSCSTLDEVHRCTGLNNAALLCQTYVLPTGAASTAPETWRLSASAGDGARPSRAAASPKSSFPRALMASTKVRELLLSLLLTASKGVVSNVVYSSFDYVGLFKPFSTIEVDDDLGFVVVQACRLLNYAFVSCTGTSSAGASPTAEQVRAAVSPLLGALSILLARFIAEENVQDAGTVAGDAAGSELYSADAAQPVDPAAALLVSAATPQSKSSANRVARRRGARDLPRVQYPCHVRLLGQLGCGILLLTTLFQQSSQTVLDTMDHSFFFDALVTALQAAGKRFAEPSMTSSADAPGGEEQNEEAVQAWSSWIQAVDVLSKKGAVPCRYNDLAHLDTLLSAALLQPVDLHLAALSDDPIVDEFLHAYLGLLAASRRLRVDLMHTLTSRGALLNNNSLSLNQGLRLEVRSLDTLDQLEQTLVKTFLTAYDAVDAIPDVVSDTNMDSVVFAGGATRSWSCTRKEEEEVVKEKKQQIAEAAKASPFPSTSCLYNLLLKHALWCLRMSRKYHHDSQPQALLLPPLANALSSATVAGTWKHSILTNPVPTPSVVSPPPLLTPPLAPSRPFTSPAYPAAVDLAGQGDDPFLLFLVHHGLFRILLHDDHYTSAFMVNLPRRNAHREAAKDGVDKTEPQAPLAHEESPTWQRSFATLLLVAHCLQLHPSTAAETSAALSSPEMCDPSSNITPSALYPTSPVAVAQGGAAGRLTPGEELLAYEAVEALMMVLRPSSSAFSSSPPPPPVGGPSGAAAGAAHAVQRTAVATTKPRYGAPWRNCLLALLTAALGSPSEPNKPNRDPIGGHVSQEDAVDTPLTSVAAPVVSEELVRCGSIEYLLQASITSAAAASTPLAQDVSFRWTMCVLQCLVADPKARVHMAAMCAKPLLLGALWNPLLRRGGQELLTSLLCQPLATSYSTADVPLIDPREASTMTFGTANDVSVSSSTATAASDAGTLAAVVAHTVPRHCRKLCESLWSVLNECVNGPLPVSNASAEAYGGVMAECAFPSASTASDEERDSVLQCVLSSLADAFHILGNDNGHSLGSAEELLPLRTLQRGIFEASREGTMHLYALLLHRLAQLWRSNTSSPTSSSLPTSFSLPPADATGAVCMLFSADEPLLPAKAGSSPPTTTTAVPFTTSRASRESVVLIVKVLMGLTRANPTLREVLYRNTMDEEALVDCVANAWTATAHRAACSSSRRSNGSTRSDDATSDECELVRLCSYLVYESIEAVDAFVDVKSPSAVDNILRPQQQHQQQTTHRMHRCVWSLQNPSLLAALLKRFPRTSLTAAQQCALRQILRTLTSTVASCQTSLYLAASTSLHEVLGQLLPVVALLPPNPSRARSDHSTSPSVSATYAAAATTSSSRLDAMLVHLLVMLARCHIDVRQLKQVLMLVIHSKELRERKALVPLVVQLLSAAVQPVPHAPLREGLHRPPQHFMTLHRGCGPAGFRAALPEFPLEGYSVSLFLRWEGELGTVAEGEAGDTTGIPVAPGLDTLVPPVSEATHSSTDGCACIFSLRTADRITVLALMVETYTRRLFVQYRNLQQQEVRVDVTTVLPSRAWSQVVFSHRPAAFLSTAAGGQMHIAVNDKSAVTVPQVAYPLMSRGHLYVGCLGHEVDRLCVAHAFYGQVSTVYFFPFVLQEREREILQGVARGAGGGTWMATSAATSTPPLRPTATTATGSRWPGAGALGGGGAGAEARTEQWLVDRATLRVDTRLSDRGHLYNLAAVLRGRAGRDSRLFTYEGTLVCSTQRVMDSMGLLGALPSVVMPLCTLLVNPTLPISFRGLVAVAQNSREPLALPSWAMVPSVHTGDAYDPSTVDAANAAILWALELIPALASSEAIRNEMGDSGLFVFLGQILQLLGSSLQVVVPPALIQLLEVLAPFPRLFEDALTNLFLSSEVMHSAPRAVQLAWVRVQRFFLQAHPDALSCLRSLGTSMFVAAEVLRMTSEEDSVGAAKPNATTVAQPSSLPTTEASCTLRDLEDQWMSYFEALTAPPVTISEAQSLQYLVENLRWSCSSESVQLRILRRVRHLVASSTSPFFVQLLGRRNYAVTLLPYIKDAPSEAVRMEALLQFLCMVFRSKRTQELMNPVLLASRETVVHVAEEVSLAWLSDVLRPFPVNLSVYLALRCGLVGQFDVAELPTSYAPLDESQTLKLAAVLLPLLMLLKRSPDAKLKAFVLTDLAVLLKSDAQAWRRVITVRGWYVSLASLFVSSCGTSPTAAAAAAATVTSPAALSPDKAGASTASYAPEICNDVPAPLRSSGLLFTTTSMILSHTLFQALLHESYGATEVALVAAYLREQRLHRLLNQVFCNIADRYRSRLLAQQNDRRKLSTVPSGSSVGGLEEAGEASTALSARVVGGDGRVNPPTATATAASFIGLGTPIALLNMCYFFRVVEVVLFYAATFLKRETPAATPTPSPSATASSGAVTTQSSSSSFLLTLSLGSSYTEWEELTLLPAEAMGPAEGHGGVLDAPTAKATRADGDVYCAGDDDDPQGNVRRAILFHPDGRWLHLPLAMKCAELLCSHSALLHLGSNGNATSINVVGGGSVVGAVTSTGGPGDALLAAVMSAASGNSGVMGNANLGQVGPAVVKGGMLRLFGRLFQMICRMTLRSATALDSIINLVDGFIQHVDRGQRGGGFLLLKRSVNADEAHEHSPIAVSMTILYNIHELLLRRLRAGECGGSATYPNANAALVDRMKSVVEIFRHSFEQLPVFVAASASEAASQAASQISSPRHRSELGGAAGGGGKGPSSLRNMTGEVYTTGVPTLQWLCDHQANPCRTVEAFVEVASRADYNAFLERCLIAVEREQLTDKALANDVIPEQRWMLRRLQDLFCENSLSKRLVHDSMEAVMESSRCARKDNGDGERTKDGGNGGLSAADDSADTSFTSFFLPSAARKVTAAARAAMWAHFTTALRGTVWNLEAAGPQQQQQQSSAATTKYVKLSSQEQQPLVHRKLVFDREGTNYSGVSMASYSSPPSPASENVSTSHPVSLGTDGVLLVGDVAMKTDTSFSDNGSMSHVSRLRRRGGEAVLLQVPEDEDAAAEEDLLRLSAEEEMRSLTAASLNDFPNRDTTGLDQLRRSPSSATAPHNLSVQSVLSVACEVPYMMHCWSASFTVRGSEVFVVIDDENHAYNQVVSEGASPYLLRPRTFSFHLSNVTQIAPGRRFRMRRTALEVWTRDRRSYFINFADTATMNAALQALRTGGAPRYPFTTSSLLHNTTGAVVTTLPSLIHHAAGGGSRGTAYVLQENPRREPMRLRAMALWRNRLLSNFDYLLVLNVLAGRTLNDITQYPVFPWILSDYTSNELDMANPATFRDLSLPMGACGSEDRRAMVRERYTEMKDLGDVPSHYFSHYSSPAVTLYFLIRLPPYTTLSILLQGGHFDHADRMFHSVQSSFKAVTTSTQDVRELIPELFYLPELCVNANRVDFGRRQNRTSMDDLQLPPWAHNDPYTFIYHMREALESPYVSAHLHEWINLIFGYKQRGKEAIDALNVFNWHSYEELDGNRDAGSVDHQLLIDSLDNIGQTPIQLFRQPHLPRPALEWADPLLLPTHVKVLPLRWGCLRVAQVVVLATDKVLVVTGNGGAASLRMHLNLIRSSAVPLAPSSTASALGGTATAAGPTATPGNARGSGSPEMHSAISPSPERAVPTSHGVVRGANTGPFSAPGAAALLSVGRAPLGGTDTGSFDVSEEYERRIAPIPAGVIPNNSPYADGSSTASSVALLCYENEVFLVLGGLFDNSVVIRSLSGAAGDVRLRAHHGRVTLVVRTGDSRYLVTGAEDTTFAVWSCQLQPVRQQLEVELLFTIYGHEDMPSAVDVSSTLDVVATASLDGVLMLHSLSTGRLDRIIRHPHNAPIHRVLVQTNCYVPNVIFLSKQDVCVYQYSINGAPLRTFTPPGRVTAWSVTSSQYFLLACQPHPHVHSTNASPTSSVPRNSNDKGETTAATPQPQHSAVAAPCILYVHSFFLEVVKTVAVPADHVVSSLSTHPSYPQVVVAGTETGRLLLLRSVTK